VTPSADKLYRQCPHCKGGGLSPHPGLARTTPCALCRGLKLVEAGVTVAKFEEMADLWNRSRDAVFLKDYRPAMRFVLGAEANAAAAAEANAAARDAVPGAEAGDPPPPEVPPAAPPEPAAGPGGAAPLQAAAPPVANQPRQPAHQQHQHRDRGNRGR
jgi:hypothetical protein